MVFRKNSLKQLKLPSKGICTGVKSMGIHLQLFCRLAILAMSILGSHGRAQDGCDTKTCRDKPLDTCHLSNCVGKLNLFNHHLTGTIPGAVANNVHLTEIGLASNLLSGTIPNGIWNLTKLTTLGLYYNQLNGTVPNGISSLTKLTFLDLNSNQLSGTIPNGISSLTKLTTLNLYYNQLSGTVPNGISRLNKLTTVTLSDTKLQGPIPVAWCKERAPEGCRASSTNLFLPAACPSGWCGLLHRNTTTTTTTTTIKNGTHDHGGFRLRTPLLSGIIIALVLVATVIVVAALISVWWKKNTRRGGALRDPLLSPDGDGGGNSLGDDIPWGRAQLLVMGEKGAGKTSLSRALRNQTFAPSALQDALFEDTATTPGIDIGYLETTGIRRWGGMSSPQYEAVDELATKLFRAEAELQRALETETGDLMPALNNALAMGLSPDISPVVRQAQSPQVSAAVDDEGPGHHAVTSPLLKAAQRRFKEVRAEASGDAASDAIITVWDFAGKPVVSFMEHVFMNPLAIYAVVFNIVNLLNENTQQRTLRCLVERLYNIVFQAPEARVLLVGSHKDELRDVENELHKAQTIVGKRINSMLNVAKATLLKHLSKPSDREWFFAVDSKSSELNASGDTQYSDPTLKNIRAKLKQIVLADDREVPGLNGLKTAELNADRHLVMLADALKSCEGSRCSFVTVERVLQLAEDIGLDVSSPEFITRILTSISVLGVARWFPDIAKDVVVLNPQWMIDPMDLLFPEGDRSELLDKLALSVKAANHFNPVHVQKGLYKDELLTCMWSSKEKIFSELNRSPEEIEALKNILQRFSVICPLDTAHKLYAVPALLPDEDGSSAVSEHIEPLLRQDKHAERRTCRWDFSESEWLPRHLCDQLMCAIVRKHEYVMMGRDVAFIRALGGVLLLRIDAEHWCIEADTVKNAAYPYSSNWMIKLVNRELDFIMTSLPPQVKPEVLLCTSDGHVKLHDLVNNDDRPVFTSTNKLITNTRMLKAKWLRSAHNSHKPAHALVIGINDYKDMGELKNAVNDARAIKEALEKEGVVVFYAENCTITQLKEIVQLYLDSLQEGEVTLVFFAGHGVEYANANRLVTIPESDVTDYKRDSLNLLLLLLRIKEKGVRISVAMLDCCRRFEYSQTRGGTVANTLDMSQMKGSSGTISVFACSRNATATDIGGGGHGLLTKYLLEHMTQPNVEVHTMLRRVGRLVFEASNGKQEPRIDSSVYDEGVCLFKTNL